MIDKIYRKNENEVYIVFDNRLPMRVITDNGTAMKLLLSVMDERTQEVKVNKVEIKKYEAA